jgi:hypothetical protein
MYLMIPKRRWYSDDISLGRHAQKSNVSFQDLTYVEIDIQTLHGFC